MKTMMRNPLILLLALAPAFAGAAGSTGLGGVFTDASMGTRPLGMGGAFVAVADDANAAQDNPAGMAFLDKESRLATFTHSNLFNVGFLSRDFIAYAQADSGFGAFGLNWNRFAATLDPEQWTEDAFAYSGAKLLSPGEGYPKISVGWQAKYMRVDSGLSDSTDGLTVGGGTATGYGLGLGLMVKLRPSLTVAMFASDLYSSLSWATGTLEIIPTTGRAGLSYRLTESTLFSAEFRGQQGSAGFGPSSWHLGAENWFFDGKQLMWNAIRNLGLRGGYFQQLANSDAGQYSVGASAKADQWQIDYTYQAGLAANHLGATHRFGVGMAF
jgi:hypothetical protein